ncbi:hypothetical protein JCM9743_35500 [Natrinema sp. JCM 9743]
MDRPPDADCRAGIGREAAEVEDKPHRDSGDESAGNAAAPDTDAVESVRVVTTHIMGYERKAD